MDKKQNQKGKIRMNTDLFGIHILENGRKYKLTDCGKYCNKSGYPTGGIHIAAWEKRLNKGNGMWIYIDNSPNEEHVRKFLRLASQLQPIQ